MRGCVIVCLRVCFVDLLVATSCCPVVLFSCFGCLWWPHSFLVFHSFVPVNPHKGQVLLEQSVGPQQAGAIPGGYS